MGYQRRIYPARSAALVLACAHLACVPTPETTGTSASTSVGSTGVGSTSVSASSTSAGPTSTSGTSDSTSSSGSDGSAGTSDGTSGSSDGSTTDCDFICDLTCGGDAVLGPEQSVRCRPPNCDPWQQDCPEGEKCSAYAGGGDDVWSALHCVPIEGDAKPGEPCVASDGQFSGRDSCELGAMCWSIDQETLEGVCVGLCDGTPDEPTCAQAGTKCTITNDGVLNLCLSACDPLSNECDDGDTCAFVEDGFSCVPGEDLGLGDPCNGPTCSDGQLCIPAPYLPDCGSENCCTPYCDIKADDPCAELDGATCIPFFMEGEAPAGLENLGVCAFPP